MKVRISDLLRSAPWRSALILLGLVGLFGWGCAYRDSTRAWGGTAGGGGVGTIDFHVVNGRIEVLDIDSQFGDDWNEDIEGLRSITVDLWVSAERPLARHPSRLLSMLGARLPVSRTDYRLVVAGGFRSQEEFEAVRLAIAEFAKARRYGMHGSWGQSLGIRGATPTSVEFSDAILKAPRMLAGTTMNALPRSWIVATAWNRTAIAASLALVLAPLAAFVLAVWAIPRWWRNWLSLTRARGNRCKRCGYLLDGLSAGSCPECGAAIQPTATA